MDSNQEEEEEEDLPPEPMGEVNVSPDDVEFAKQLEELPVCDELEQKLRTRKIPKMTDLQRRQAPEWSIEHVYQKARAFRFAEHTAGGHLTVARDERTDEIIPLTNYVNEEENIHRMKIF